MVVGNSDSVKKITSLVLMLALSFLSACASKQSISYLAEIDVKKEIQTNKKSLIEKRSEGEIRRAYAEYLDNAAVDDNSRVDALNRLAELEIVYSNQLLKNKENLLIDEDEFEDRLYEARLDKTIKLLGTSLKDYPDTKNNDVVMYQLAKALDLKGRHQESIDTLNQLIEKYPGSEFYVEAQFRVAEDAFSVSDYSTAEYAYTEVIVARKNEIFYEKALFKRGWARFKQQYYTDAVDDLIETVLQHNFDEFENLDKAEKELFEEYFRAVGLAFSYLGGSAPLHDYFKDRVDFKYTYYTYSMLSNIYLKQERFTDAVESHKQFMKHYPNSNDIPYSQLAVIEIWKNSGFTNKIYSAIENFYVRYNPSSNYWINQNEDSSVNRAIRRSLKKYIILMSGFYHHKFQETGSSKDFKTTDLWYQRYLKHYNAYAQNDKIYFLYAELLNQRKNLPEAFKYYELAAYENDLIVHKDAAYASIITSNKLINQHPDNKQYVRKHIDYALKYSLRYPDSKRSQQLIKHAAELAFNAGEFKNTIELVDVKFATRSLESDLYLAGLKSQSYFNLKEYIESESLYTQLLKAPAISSRQKTVFSHNLAISIYQQGKIAVNNQQFAQAIKHYSRISQIIPSSKIASTGLYDAIALNMQHQQWKSAITDIKRFQTLFPKHQLQADVSKKLSVAYLSSNQGIKAAREFEKISSMSKDKNVKSAALWQAAELYQQKKKYKDAIRAYETFVATYKKPYAQYLEALNELSKLTLQTGAGQESNKWKSLIIKADNKTLNNAKNDRTRHIVSLAYLELARSEKSRFDSVRLSLPLNKSLIRKKNAMQAAVKLYGKSSLNKDYATTTEATFSIATIYKDFSKALLDSDRPVDLNEEELDQYEILLEDKAFPFEDKSIEFYEINMSRIKQGHFNSWIEKSLQKLIQLFPVRYSRHPKQDSYVSEYQ